MPWQVSQYLYDKSYKQEPSSSVHLVPVVQPDQAGAVAQAPRDDDAENIKEYDDVDFGDDDHGVADRLAQEAKEAVRDSTVGVTLKPNTSASSGGDVRLKSCQSRNLPKRRDTSAYCPSCGSPFGSIKNRDCCLACGHVFRKTERNEESAKIFMEALQPKVIETTRGGRSVEGVERRLYKDYARRAKKMGFESVAMRWKGDPLFRRQMMDQGSGLTLGRKKTAWKLHKKHVLSKFRRCLEAST